MMQQYHVLYWNNHKYVIYACYKWHLDAWGHLLWRKQKRKCYLSLQFISKQQLTLLLWRSLFQKCPIVTIYGLGDNDVFRKNEHIRNFGYRRKLSEISNQRRKETLYCFRKDQLQNQICKNENCNNNGIDGLQKIIICKNGKLSA